MENGTKTMRRVSKRSIRSFVLFSVTVPTIPYRVLNLLLDNIPEPRITRGKMVLKIVAVTEVTDPIKRNPTCTVYSRYP